MLEKLIIELGGVVPQDKLGLGDESSKSLVKNSPSPAKLAENLTENSGNVNSQHGAQTTPFNENDGLRNVAAMETGVGAGESL